MTSDATTVRAQPDAVGPERPRLGDHRAALRGVNTSTAINRQLQSRDMTDEIVANQTNLTAASRRAASATP